MNYTCRWDETESMCERLTCGDFETEEECEVYSTDEYNQACAWNSGDEISVCYNDCPKLYEIVFTVDTSLSVIEADADNRENQATIVLQAMTFAWELGRLQNRIDENDEAAVAEVVKFALVTFSGEDSSSYTITHFDLNNDFASITEYQSEVSSIFSSIDYMDGTPTVAALTVSRDIFENSPFDQSDVRLRRLEALITDGRPNEPATFSSPCSSVYDFNNEYSDLGVRFYAFFVGFEQTSFNCLAEAPLGAVFRNIEDFTSLTDTFDIFSTEVCRGPYPTGAPTSAPTRPPTPSPTTNPTGFPTDAPTFSPTGSPTPGPSPAPTRM